MTSSFSKFRLLVWKNFLQQWRHKGQTLAEILLPALVASLLILLRQQVEPSRQPNPEISNATHFQYPPLNAYSLRFSAQIISQLNYTELNLAYSPNSPVIERVLRTAGVRLMRENVQLLTQLNSSIFDSIPIAWLESQIRLVPYNSSEQLEDLYLTQDSTREVLAAVQFDDSLLDATELPDNISFKLRFPIRPRQFAFFFRGGPSWRTGLVFPTFATMGPRFGYSWEGGNDPGYVNEMFIALQHCITLHLIAEKSGDSSVLEIPTFIQRYPHPSYVRDLLTSILPLLLPMFVMVSFSYTATSTVKAVITEKEQQLKEAMKIMGLPTWLHWTAWFVKQFLFLLITVAIMTILMKAVSFETEDGLTGYSIFTLTPWTVIVFFLSAYIATAIFFSFMVSVLFYKSNNGSLFSSMVWFLSYFPYILISMDNAAIPRSLKMFSCLSVNTAMAIGFERLLASEESGQGMAWGNFFREITPNDPLTFGDVIIMMFVDCVLYMLITLYLEQVFPGAYGISQPWYFPFQLSYWMPSRIIKQDTRIALENSYDDVLVKEKEAMGQKVGVAMHDLTKVFNKSVAVDKLTLNIYKDQITVLLGHNGAGKTTTISMLTGMIPATSGSAVLAGFEIGSETEKARSRLGVCPQHNIIFNDLTVREHLEFFSRLKGLQGKDLQQDIEELIEKLELSEKGNVVAGSLSGGQKRRLCVGIALCGRPEVVLLDEPTSGMDPASRRALWDLLQREKYGRAMILTTHFMDEADILGDCIAIMSNGKLKCVGSPFFLKKYYGCGQTLVIVKTVHFNMEACMELLNKHVPEVVLESNAASEIVFVIPNEQTPKLEAMLLELDSKQELIGYKTYGFTATSIEQVFMKVGSDVSMEDLKNAIEQSKEDLVAPTDSDGSLDKTNTPRSRKTVNKNLNYAENASETSKDSCSTSSSVSQNVIDVKDNTMLYPGGERIIGARLLYNHMRSMCLKRFYVTFRGWRTLLAEIFVPIVLVAISMGSFKFSSFMGTTAPSKLLTLEQIDSVNYGDTVTLLSYNYTGGNPSLTNTIIDAYVDNFLDSNHSYMMLERFNYTDPEDYYYRMAETSLNDMRTKYVVGASINETAITAWFSNFGYHDVAVTLATLHSAIYKALVPGGSISIENHPLPVTFENQVNLVRLGQLSAMQFSISVGVAMALTASFFVIFYVKERLIGAKLLQKSSGIHPAIMWGSEYLCDLLRFAVISVGVLLTLVALRVHGFDTFDSIGAAFAVIMVYAMSVLPLIYFTSLLFTGPIAGFVLMYFINLLLGSTAFLIVEALRNPELSTQEVAEYINIVLQFWPTYALIGSLRGINSIGIIYTTCNEICDLWPGACSLDTLCEANLTICCIEDDPIFLWDSPGISKYLVTMLSTGFVMTIMLMLIEYRVFQKLVYCSSPRPPAIDQSKEDSDVAEEKYRVEAISDDKLSVYNVVCKDLTKCYKKFVAVNQLSFTVNQGECFGLLGVNGAGKTTTFGMLTGDLSISSGDAFVRGDSIKTHLTKVHRHIGYCPQFDALFEELSGRETLKIYALLRGIPSKTTALLTQQLAESLGFVKHLDKLVSQYSGGNRRKLSTAVALLGDASLIFLDEPTTGVDPAAKRQVWRAIRNTTNVGRSVVLTSHSMEECEALCHRLAIMVNGRFSCLGSLQHLKNKFSQGYTLTLKIHHEDEIVENTTHSNILTTRKIAVDRVQAFVKEHFPTAQTVETYQGMMTFYLPDTTVTWSRMFGILEKGKREEAIEDYSILQTTLEQVFLRFTKFQKFS